MFKLEVLRRRARDATLLSATSADSLFSHADDGYCDVCLLLAGASAHGSGAWADPGHTSPDNPLAGMRYISEVQHKLTMVGTDDGSSWWSLTGYCTSPETGPPMTLIHFDFSPKGGPANLVGTWAKMEDGVITLTWPDGNAWTMVGVSADSVNVPPKMPLGNKNNPMVYNTYANVGILGVLGIALLTINALKARRDAAEQFTKLEEEKTAATSEQA